MRKPLTINQYTTDNGRDETTPPGWRVAIRDYLFGIGSAIDPLPVPGGIYKTFYTDDEAALCSDWQAIGRDLQLTAWSVGHLSNAGAADERGREDRATTASRANRKHVTAIG